MDLHGIVLTQLIAFTPTGHHGDGWHEGCRASDLGRQIRPSFPDDPPTNAQVAGALRSLAHYGLATRDISKDARYWPTPAAIKAAECWGIDDAAD